MALKLKFIRQEQRKTLTLKYNRSDAVQRSYSPQGFFGLQLDQLADKNTYFVEVDLDDSFFSTLGVTLEAPLDCARIGLQSVQAAIDYGDPQDPLNHRSGDFVFDKEHTGTQKFEVFLNAQRDTLYRLKVQFHFDAQSGWVGHQNSYEFNIPNLDDRSLSLTPFENLGFLDLRLVPDRIDWGAVHSLEVAMR